MKFSKTVGIGSYGVSLPHFKLSTVEIERAQGQAEGSVAQSLGVEQKTVPARDEDSATLGMEAAAQALDRMEDLELSGEQLRQEIGAVFVGSESHPYAVKPTGTMIKQALGLAETTALADLQFACKAGTQALQICAAYVQAKLIRIGLAIGSDTAQARPGDALEYTASGGAGAYLIASHDLLARLIASVSIASDTPDFWRRPGQEFPQHAGRFTGEPAYFHHVECSTKLLLDEVGLKQRDIDWCVFHTPNAKFPIRVAKRLGFSMDQLEPSLVVRKIGNTYAAAAPIALAAVLDQAKAGDKILVTAYGSGAGADSFLFETTKLLVEKRRQWNNLVTDQIDRLKPVDYQTYQQWLLQRGH